MQLYFLRHGNAIEPEKWHGAEELRPLTDAGREEMRHVARGLKWLGLAPDAILSSPYTRARETAEVVGATLSIPVSLAAGLAPGCDLRGLAETLAGISATSPSNAVLVVGHEPDLSGLIGELIGRLGTAEVEMKKASCARVDVAVTSTSIDDLAGRGALCWLLRAKHLARLGA